MTVIVVTHEMASAFRIADRIAMLDQGSFAVVGTKEGIAVSLLVFGVKSHTARIRSDSGEAVAAVLRPLIALLGKSHLPRADDPYSLVALEASSSPAESSSFLLNGRHDSGR